MVIFHRLTIDTGAIVHEVVILSLTIAVILNSYNRDTDVVLRKKFYSIMFYMEIRNEDCFF